MLAKVKSAAVIGLDAYPVEVEVDIVSGSLPSFNIVGLPDKSVEESRERVRSAIKNSGALFPDKRITVNLAPADMPKEGPSYDLPIALGILLASGQLQADLSKALVLGELSLDGSLRHTNGVLPKVIFAKEKGFTEVFTPAQNSAEAAFANTVNVYPVTSLTSLFNHLNGQIPITPLETKSELTVEESFELDMKDIRGQEQAKRALEIAAAGGHNVLLKGPPGSGKTLLARTFPSILPKLIFEESLEISRVYSVMGMLKDGLVSVRPFRAPHHSSSHVGLVGGGAHPRPGEISLAHRGVLFLDELAEFPRHTLEALRQPLEDGYISVSRASGTCLFPARFTLIAATNPCPCGYLDHPVKDCVCSPGQIIKYRKRISGPILDRIDLHVGVPDVQTDKLTGNFKSESSAQIRERVQKAREAQWERFKDRKISSNAEMNNREIKEFCPQSVGSLSLLRAAVAKFSLSARSFFRILKVSRTIADLAGEKEVNSAHIAEALQYRTKDEN